MFINSLKHLKTRHVFVVTFVVLIVLLIAINFRMTSSRLLSIDYKVFGRVQGVFFRKFTKQRADELSLFGWVKNSRDGTVIGTIEGSEPQINTMKEWLQTTGSPYSRIDRCEFTNERVINGYEFKSFEVRH